MKSNKGISLISITVATVILIIISLIFIAIVLKISNLEADVKKNENASLNINQETCNHEWVITSRYDFIMGLYKTISKCTKCGKEI